VQIRYHRRGCFGGGAAGLPSAAAEHEQRELPIQREYRDNSGKDAPWFFAFCRKVGWPSIAAELQTRTAAFPIRTAKIGVVSGLRLQPAD
jgi:hypothetical protein